MGDTLRVTIVQQGAWRSALPTMPLAAGYLKAAALADPTIAAAAAVEILNLPGGCDLRTAAVELARGGAPDVVAFSVLGWNARSFAELARTYKQLRPEGLVVFGGNHVSDQGAVVLAREPAVDIVVNGEGELTFAELLRWRLAGGDRAALGAIAGISYRRSDRSAASGVETTPARARTSELDELPSPLLTGAIALHDEHGRFPYDVALLETNRGCPYKCSFCYWGGAVGARVHEFSRERLRAELELLGEAGVESVVLCDANFGMRAADLAFVEDLLATRARHGAPRSLDASWTKNKSAVFYDIVRLMRREGLTSSFTLALQSLDPSTLDGMARRNMQINEWRDLARFLRDQGLDAYAELIWGAPGETPASFFAGYDALAEVVPRIAVYPLLVMPNTAYDVDRERHGLITVRGADDDFEYVLAHRTMTPEENLEVQRVVFWARVLAEHAYLRSCWEALALVPGLTQSAAVRAWADRIDADDEPLARELHATFRPFADSPAVIEALRLLHTDRDGADALLHAWWEHDVVAAAPEDRRAFLRSVLRYDLLTRPVHAPPDQPSPHPIEHLDGVAHHVLAPAHLDHDVPDGLRRWPDEGDAALAPRSTTVELVARTGFHRCMENHELAIRYLGRPRGERYAGQGAEPGRI